MEERDQAPNEGATGHVDPEEAAAEADTAAAEDAAGPDEPNQGATGDELEERAGEDD
jgi:hypothetical protein